MKRLIALISHHGKTTKQLAKEVFQALKKYNRVSKKDENQMNNKFSNLKKIYPKDLMKLVKIRKEFEKKSLSFRQKHIHQWELADVPPQPGFGIFNQRIFKICSSCGKINQ